MIVKQTDAQRNGTLALVADFMHMLNSLKTWSPRARKRKWSVLSSTTEVAAVQSRTISRFIEYAMGQMQVETRYDDQRVFLEKLFALTPDEVGAFLRVFKDETALALLLAQRGQVWVFGADVTPEFLAIFEGTVLLSGHKRNVESGRDAKAQARLDQAFLAYTSEQGETTDSAVDTKRIVSVGKTMGLTISTECARAIWQEYSGNAPDLELPDDQEVSNIIESFIERAA